MTRRGIGIVHRTSGVLLGIGLWVFGALGLINQLGFFATRGPDVLGLSTNGLLSVISLVVGTILVAAGIRGGRTASTCSVVVGALFMLSGVANALVLNTELNLLAFGIPNVVFSLVAGCLLLILGGYGRFSGRLPSESPYGADRTDPAAGPVDATHGDRDPQLPEEPEDVVAAAELAEAERVVAAGGGTDEDRRRVHLTGRGRDQVARRALWRRSGAGR